MFGRIIVTIPPSFIHVDLHPSLHRSSLVGGYTTDAGVASYMRSVARQAGRRQRAAHKKRRNH